MTLFFAAVLAAMTLRRFSVVVVGSRGVLVRLGGVRVPVFLSGYGVVRVKRTGIGCAGLPVFPMIRAIADAPYAENSDAHEPWQPECPRENAEQGTDSRLSGSSHLQSLASLALGHWHPADSVFEKSVPTQFARVRMLILRRRGRLRYGGCSVWLIPLPRIMEEHCPMKTDTADRDVIPSYGQNLDRLVLTVDSEKWRVAARSNGLAAPGLFVCGCLEGFIIAKEPGYQSA
jgi:hypothetical protein